MKAIRYHDYGGPEKLSLEEIPVPEPADGQVLVKVIASAVNPWDWKMRSGFYKAHIPAKFPMIPGIEGAGTIAGIGTGVTGFEIGQEVYGPFMASNAEYCISPASETSPKPEILSFEEAAAVPVTSQAAYSSIVEIGGLQKGQSILIHGGAGSVGVLAIQIAKWKGAYVYTTGAADNLDFLHSIGADKVIDYEAERFENVVRDADVVLDTIGGETGERSWQVLRKGGIMVTIVAQASPEKAAQYGVRSAYRSSGISKEGLLQIQALFNEGKIEPVVRKIFHLPEAAAAHALGESGVGRGKIILKT